MSTLTTTPAAASTATPASGSGKSLGVTQFRVVRSEWTKFRSLRSTIVTLSVAVILTVGMGALFTRVTASEWSTYSAADKAGFDPIGLSLGGFLFSQLALGVLAVLLITGEYSTGMIRASLTAVPRRLPVLWGKLAVFAGVVFAIGLAASAVSFTIGQALLQSTGRSVGFDAAGALRSVLGAALYVTVAGMVAMGLGALLRNTAAAITTFVGVFFLLPPLTSLLPSAWSTQIAPYLPSNAGGALWGMGASSAGGGDGMLSPWTGFALLCLYAAVVIAAGAWRLRRADA
jgi:ABC-type transport system involved in multi-copper enzyme maturation permease subunit